MKLGKIFYIDRDRALEIMIYMDSLYKKYKIINFSMVRDTVTYDEWLITQMYFLDGYRADKIIDKLETTRSMF